VDRFSGEQNCHFVKYRYMISQHFFNLPCVMQSPFQVHLPRKLQYTWPISKKNPLCYLCHDLLALLSYGPMFHTENRTSWFPQVIIGHYKIINSKSKRPVFMLFWSVPANIENVLLIRPRSRFGFYWPVNLPPGGALPEPSGGGARSCTWNPYPISEQNG